MIIKWVISISSCFSSSTYPQIFFNLSSNIDIMIFYHLSNVTGLLFLKSSYSG